MKQRWMKQAWMEKEKVMEEKQCCFIQKTQPFLPFNKLIIMVATDEVTGNFYWIKY